VFVLQHTIHHEAVIAVLLAGRGKVLPGHFGLAPSSPRVSEAAVQIRCGEAAGGLCNRNEARFVEPEERPLPIAG
jgi:hypothetical protein